MFFVKLKITKLNKFWHTLHKNLYDKHFSNFFWSVTVWQANSVNVWKKFTRSVQLKWFWIFWTFLRLLTFLNFQILENIKFWKIPRFGKYQIYENFNSFWSYQVLESFKLWKISNFGTIFVTLVQYLWLCNKFCQFKQ